MSGKVERLPVLFLIDGGCTLNLLASRVFEKLFPDCKHSLEPFQHQVGKLADGSSLQFLGKLNLTGRLRSEFVKISFVIADIDLEAILGMPFLQSQDCHVRFADSILSINGRQLPCTDRHGIELASKVQVIHNVIIPPYTEQLVPCKLSNPISSDIGMVESCSTAASSEIALAASIHSIDRGGKVLARCVNPCGWPISLRSGSLIGRCNSVAGAQLVEDGEVVQVRECVAGVLPHQDGCASLLPEHIESLYQEATVACSQPHQKQDIRKLLVSYSDVFSTGDNDMGLTKLVSHSIPVKSGTKPIKQAPRRLGTEKEAEVDRQIQKLQHQGLIEPGQGAWSSPVVLVKKKDGSWRFCIDYRRLNAVTVHDAHPLPRIDESLEALAGSQYFTTLDLMSGYWQVPLEEDARDKAAFCTRNGLWRWKVLPFGLTAAPATFQRLMERVLHGLHWKSLLLYLDDIIVIGNSFDNHYQNLKEVLSRLRAAGLKLKPAKCHLFQTKVAYLGHVVSCDGVATDPDKTAAVANWPIPRYLSELRAFLGTVGYYRQYIPSFSSKARPLNVLTSKHVQFKWTTECQDAFQSLKHSLMVSPVLGYPDPSLSYSLDTDASLDGVGAVLSQVQNGQERVISYYSRSLSIPERNYCVTRRELLAVVKAVTHFRPYLYGKEFRIRTDHASLLWLCRRTTPSAQIARWLEILSEFNFIIEYRAGSKHGNADGLSRQTCHNCKQCDRITRLNGGPSMDTLCTEIKQQQSYGEPVTFKITGERLYAFNIESTGSSDCISPCSSVKNHLDEVPSALPVDLMPPVDQGLSNQPGNHGCGHQDSAGGDDHASTLVEKQKLSEDVAIVYDAVLNQQELDQSIVNLGSPELKKLSTMLSLMRIREDGVLVIRLIHRNRPRETIVCPKDMRQQVMWSTHTLAHTGVWRTLHRLRLTWYWPGITADVRRVVKSCEVCQIAKTGGLNPSSSNGPLWVGRPWQKVAVDLVGPLPLTARGNKWILVLTDHFTRWQDALPIPDATAPMVAEVLDSRVFCYFGLPEEIHSDRGSQFEGDLMTELCELWHVAKTRTTPYHPQSNGVVERGNRTLGDALRTMLLSYAYDQSSWDILLPQVMRAFRATPQTSTEETANFMMLGRECRLPDQLLYGTHSQQLSTRTEYALELKTRLESVHSLLRQHQQLPIRSADRQEESRFKPGDLVLIQSKRRRKGLNPKLQPKFEGPFSVQEVFGNGTCRVNRRGTVNASRLKLFSPCSALAGQPTLPSQEAAVDRTRPRDLSCLASPGADA